MLQSTKTLETKLVRYIEWSNVQPWVHHISPIWPHYGYFGPKNSHTWPYLAIGSPSCLKLVVYWLNIRGGPLGPLCTHQNDPGGPKTLSLGPFLTKFGLIWPLASLAAPNWLNTGLLSVLCFRGRWCGKSYQICLVMAEHVMCKDPKEFPLSTSYFGVLNWLCGGRYIYLAITLQKVVEITWFFGSLPKSNIYEHLIV